jgi:hypothetical protein
VQFGVFESAEPGRESSIVNLEWGRVQLKRHFLTQTDSLFSFPVPYPSPSLRQFENGRPALCPAFLPYSSPFYPVFLPYLIDTDQIRKEYGTDTEQIRNKPPSGNRKARSKVGGE